MWKGYRELPLGSKHNTARPGKARMSVSSAVFLSRSALLGCLLMQLPRLSAKPRLAVRYVKIGKKDKDKRETTGTKLRFFFNDGRSSLLRYSAMQEQLPKQIKPLANTFTPHPTPPPHRRWSWRYGPNHAGHSG